MPSGKRIVQALHKLCARVRMEWTYFGMKEMSHFLGYGMIGDINSWPVYFITWFIGKGHWVFL